MLLRAQHLPLFAARHALSARKTSGDFKGLLRVVLRVNQDPSHVAE
jgi:hypothetical protein